jgi:hypothetical protein
MNPAKGRQSRKPNRVAQPTDKKVNREGLHSNSGYKHSFHAASPPLGFKASPLQRERFDAEQEDVRAEKCARRGKHLARKITPSTLI